MFILQIQFFISRSLQARISKQQEHCFDKEKKISYNRYRANKRKLKQQ